MKKSLLITGPIAAILFFAGVATTHAKIDSLAGRKSITVNASHQITSIEDADDDSKSTLLTLGFSYYPKDFLETKVGLLGMKIDSGDFDTTIYSLSGVVNYNFFRSGAVVVPYIGAQLGLAGYDSGEYDDTSFSYGGQGGVKFFLSEDLSLNVELNYLITNISDDEGEDVDVKNTSLLLGFSYYF